MKKFITSFLLVIFVLGMLVSCSDNESEEPIFNTKNIERITFEEPIFNTKNIERITFYAYYGGGKGSDVPAENMSEFITWLETFTIDKDKKVDDILPPGTNTYFIEIEYLDGTIIKQGLDIIAVDGTVYYLKHAKRPDSFKDIISKTSIE